MTPNVQLPTLQSLRPALARAAQKVYDRWDESDVDTYAGGGICHLIVDALLPLIPYEGTSVSSNWEVHVYIVCRVLTGPERGIWKVDIHPSYYETGGGYTWAKIPDVEFDASMISLERLSYNPHEIGQYTGDGEDEWDEIEGDDDEEEYLHTCAICHSKTKRKPRMSNIERLPDWDHLQSLPLEGFIVLPLATAKALREGYDKVKGSKDPPSAEDRRIAKVITSRANRVNPNQAYQDRVLRQVVAGRRTYAGDRRYRLEDLPPLFLRVSGNTLIPQVRGEDVQILYIGQGGYPLSFGEAGVPIFTATSKMSALSFSLPAGSVSSGGSCAAAPGPRPGAGPTSSTGAKPDEDPPGINICAKCYAQGGNYLNAVAQLPAFLRQKWVLQNRGQVGPLLLHALERAGEGVKPSKLNGINLNYFRIHDAGDFSPGADPKIWPAYIQAWTEVAKGLPHVHFWAPTRLWKVGALRPAFEALAKLKNVTIRPSAFTVGEDPPVIPSLSAGSTVLAGHAPPLPKVWACPVYTTDGIKSCEAAGCRTCWDRPKMPVSYTLH